MKNLRIGEVLKEDGYITDEQLNEALALQKQGDTRLLGTILIDRGYVTERQKLSALAKRLGEQLVDLDTYPVEIEAVRKVPQPLAEKYAIIAVSESGGRLTIVTSEPLEFYSIEDVRLAANMPVAVCLDEKAKIEKAIDYYYAEIQAKEAVSSANQNIQGEELSFEDIGDADDDATPVVRLLNSLLVRGYNTNASDIHIEPFQDRTTVRMRIDGMIIDYANLSPTIHQSLIARTKILSNLDIAEKRVPQDGHFRTSIDGYVMNVRVSVIPTVYGEKAVLRFLSTNTPIPYASQFGMPDTEYHRLMEMLAAPHGIIYLTGPTGSGKTTTLYMALEYLARRQVNISTIEDPVERNLDRVNQMQVNAAAGLTFETGLRALLRQDPDVIMVGETRDNETASISVRAAITGHLVLSTLHTNDAVSAIIRLQDMGVEPFLIANSLTGVVAQRLMRTICANCKKEVPATDLDRLLLGSDVTSVHRGEGCHICNNTGYKGRIAVHEIITIDRAMRRMIAAGDDMDTLTDYLRKEQRMSSLRDAAARLVRAGVTTVEEMKKITVSMD